MMLPADVDTLVVQLMDLRSVIADVRDEVENEGGRRRELAREVRDVRDDLRSLEVGVDNLQKEVQELRAELREELRLGLRAVWTQLSGGA